MEDILFDAVGLIGVVCILLAYYLITVGKLTGKDISYHLINMLGAILLLISLYWTPNLASIVIEICWLAISFYGIYGIVKSRRS